MGKYQYRSLVWGVICTAIIGLYITYGIVTTDFNVAGIERTIIAAALGMLGLAAVFFFPNFRTRKSTIIAILAICTVARIAVIPASPSDDINRYLWEGKLTTADISPYDAVGSDERYTEYRDQYWEKMNNIDVPTAYPPLSLEIFSAINFFHYSPLSYKWIFTIIDLAVIAMLMMLLTHHRLPLHYALFYGLSPITILAFSAEAHFDIVMVASFTLALLSFSKRWFIACGVALGIAVGVKIMALVIAPLILWRTGWKGMSAFAITLLLPLIFYWNDIGNVINALYSFGSKGAFNGPIHQIFRYLFDDLEPASKVIALLYIACWFFAFYLMLKRQLWSSLLVAFGGLIILSPIVHFWYLTWVLPLIVLRPKLSWAALSVSFSFYFIVWNSQEFHGYWGLPTWAKWFFWSPFFAFFIPELKHVLAKIRRPLRTSEPVTWSVIIPTYQTDQALLTPCLDSLANQSTKPDEIIISNAGPSIDISHPSLNIKVIASNKGRGEQIKNGVLAANQSWVMILHSDVILPSSALESASNTIDKNPHIIAGGLGQRFDENRPGLMLIEAMNEFRLTLMQTSFGDQSQFFHRTTATENDVLTEQKLMEDVEMSDRLNSLGDTVLIADEGSVSARKWTKSSFWKRFFTIIEFMLRYRLSFTKAKRMSLCDDFYKRYYGS